LFTFAILLLTLTLKFFEGGWVTVLITGALISICYAVHRHYARVQRAIDQLEVEILPQLYQVEKKQPAPYDPAAPTAAILVSGFNGLGLSALLTITRLFHDQFRNVVFVSVGEVDSALLKGPEEVKALEERINEDLQEYCRFAGDLGLHPELRSAIGPDVVLELRRVCLEIAHEFTQVVYFAGKLVFTDELDRFGERFLNNHTSLDIQSWLQLYGLSLVIVPIRIGGPPLDLPPAAPSLPDKP
jgi:hypothetical protein